MNLECVNGIVTNNLAIHIDLTNTKSWDLNTGFTSINLFKWDRAISDNINLFDFGLTGFDNGRTNEMWTGIKLTPNDTLFTMYRIGYNEVNNPTPEQTSGMTITTKFDDYSLYANTTGNTYFTLNGGYLQGFFKLDGYNYELLPARYGKGITIENLLYITENSYGIFYMMGIRAEDKYNPYYQGEFSSGNTISGINTSDNNYLESFTEYEVRKSAFRLPEDSKKTIYSETSQMDNIKNNVISFELTENKNIKYKYVNGDGILIQNTSENTVNTTGFTLITITFTPDYDILDAVNLKCEPQRNGTLRIFINGNLFWIIKNFPEFYFKPILNSREKQIGVPYSISWGGGSFGLKHSWHYENQTYLLYDGQITQYINDNFIVKNDNNEVVMDIQLSGDNTTFTEDDLPLTVMRAEYTGSTEKHNYFIEFNKPITVLSNRDYTIKSNIYNNNLFNLSADNNLSLIVYSYESDIEIVDELTYNGSENKWKEISTTFRLPDNIGKREVFIGLKIESTTQLIENGYAFIKDLTYSGADILVQDERKENIFIEQNFNSSFIGGIQKLRIYDMALSSLEVQHNALIESKTNPDIVVSRGGRIIYR